MKNSIHNYKKGTNILWLQNEQVGIRKHHDNWKDKSTIGRGRQGNAV